MATSLFTLKISVLSLLVAVAVPAFSQTSSSPRQVRKPVQKRATVKSRAKVKAPRAAPAPAPAPAVPAVPAEKETTPPVVESVESTPAVVVNPRALKWEWVLGLGFWNWTEELEMRSGGTSDTDVANYRADVLDFGYRRNIRRWGYDIHGLILTGKAGAGGSSLLVPYKGERSWTGFGARVGGYFRVANQIEVGLVVPVIYRDSKWPTPSEGFVVEGEKTPLVAPMIAWRMFPTDYLLIEQALGVVGKKGSSIWSLQAQFLF